MNAEFPSKCPKCGHVEMFYTKEGKDRFDIYRINPRPEESLRASWEPLGHAPLMQIKQPDHRWYRKHLHPVRDFWDDIQAAKAYQLVHGETK